ncbi:MAG: c-type cytochrome [Verrucomicrobiia bacterium]
MGVKVPDLSHERLVLKGAGHYETGCASCHGSPARARSAVADYMLPPPPRLQEIRSHRDPEELFYIIKHGIKFTGMPSWPSRQRDDEVWAMVAFILRLPELDGAGYQRLVRGDMEDAETADNGIAAIAAQRCARCHGTDGNGRGTGAFPKLAGQRSEYLYASLQAYAKGERHSGVMEPVAATLESETMRALAQYYSQLTPSLSLEHPDASFARGEAVVNNGIPLQRVPACAACHLNPSVLRNPFYPNLAGQYPEYIELQLELFKSRSRGGTAYAHIMQQVAAELTEEQIRDVAGYFSRTGPSPQKGE